MDINKLLSDNINIVGEALSNAINIDRNSPEKERAREGKRYYLHNHDILQNRIFYIDDNDVIREDCNASNVKIPHSFLTELVDQKVQYLLSRPVQAKSDDEKLNEYLKEYYNDDLQLFLQEAVEGASLKGFEYAYCRTNSDGRICFQIADSLQTFPIYDDNGEVVKIVRYYDKELYREGKMELITFAEVWDNTQVTFYSSTNNKPFSLEAMEINPRPHILAETDDGKLLHRAYNRIPFFRLSNNKYEKTDLEPIKALVDDYDIMACFLSNNLQDFSEAIYVVKGFKGDDLSKLRQNLKSKKTVGVGSDGGVEVTTVDIPVAARESKLEIDKQGIYKFGMGFDSSQIQTSRGNVTNVAIQSGYSLLNMKCNKAETRLRTLIKWMNELIIDDINDRYNTSFSPIQIEISMERETMTDKKENAEIEKLEQEIKAAALDNILLIAPRIDDETTLRMICEQMDLDYTEITQSIKESQYTMGLGDDTDALGDV